MQIRHKRVRPTIFLVGCVLIILLGGGATFLWQSHSEVSVRAASGDVVGPPTLPAATVNTIFASMGSPMAGSGAVVEQAARQANIDDAFALAVWWTETNDGAAGVGLADRNPGSVRGSAGYPAAYDGYTIYPSYSAAIFDWFNVLRVRYVDRGLTSAYTICYPYVGTSSSYQWAIKVANLMLRYHGEAPAPTSLPMSTPKPKPTAIISTPGTVHVQHIHHKAHVVKPALPLLGRTHEAHISGNVVSPVVTRQDTSTTVSAHSSVTPSSPAVPFIILSGLLAALLIALWGMRIGRSIPTVNPLPVPIAPEQPVPSFGTSAITSLAAVYTNGFSLIPQTEQLSWASEPLPQPIPSFARTPQVSAQPVPTFANAGGGGLLKRYANTDALPRRIRLQPVDVPDESIQRSFGNENWYGSFPETLAISSSPTRSVQEEETPELVTVGARPPGLVRRYTLQRHDNNE